VPGKRKRAGWRHCCRIGLRADPAVFTEMWLWLTFAAVEAGAFADLQYVPPFAIKARTMQPSCGRAADHQHGRFAVQHSRKPGVHGRAFTLCPAHGRSGRGSTVGSIYSTRDKLRVELR